VRATWHLETPVITNPSAVPFARVARLAHDHGYKAVLTGEGADELFLGYPRLASGGLERLAGAPVAAIRRAYRRVPGLADAVLDERDNLSSAFLRGVAGGFEDDELARAAAERYDFLPPKDAARHAVSAVMVQTSLQALLQRNDRMGMAASIESRFPFLDEEVVALALNLPVDLKLRRSRAVHDPKHPFVVDKAPVRAVAAGLLGEEAVNRRKNGFPTPGLHAVRVRRGAFEGSWVADAFGGGRGFSDPIADWPQSYDVGKLLSIEIFGRLFGARQPIAEVEAFVRDAVAA
jgi:asparagine synthase (glutamine-hydrolysing)